MSSVKKTDLKSVFGMFERAMTSFSAFVTSSNRKSPKSPCTSCKSRTASKKTSVKTVTPKSEKRICATKGNRKRYFNSVTECSEKLSIDHSNMSKVLHGKRKTAGGYRFEYVD